VENLREITVINLGGKVCLEILPRPEATNITITRNRVFSRILSPILTRARNCSLQRWRSQCRKTAILPSHCIACSVELGREHSKALGGINYYMKLTYEL
jgi:hypothetical protein